MHPEPVASQPQSSASRNGHVCPTRHDTFDLGAILKANQGRTLELHEQFVNPAFAAVLRTIGFDQTFVRGQGAYLWDDRGNRYIDCLGGYAVFNLGRNHPTVRQAVRQAMDLDLPNLLGVGAWRLAGTLARELTRIMPGAAAQSDQPGPLDTVFFASAGTEAIEVALKHARAATGRTGIIYCARSYHGLSLGSLSVCGNPEFRDGFGPLLPGTREIPFNDLPALESALSDRTNPAAAFIVEPIQGKGVHMPEPGYLREAAALCRKHGALLILDEIQTGFGRSGRMWACEHFGAGKTWLPDILVCAKALSGGYIPCSAVISRRWIHAKVFGEMRQCSRIQTTFGMNDLAMAAGLATLHVLEHERIIEHTAEVGEYLLAGLRRTLLQTTPSGARRYQMVRDVRGMGLFIAVEFQPPTSLGLRAGWELLHKLDDSLFCQAVIMPLMTEHRILAQVAGHKMDIIKLIPPLVLSREDADHIIAAFEKTIAACHHFPGPAWEVGKKLSGAAMRRFSTGRTTGAAAASR